MSKIKKFHILWMILCFSLFGYGIGSTFYNKFINTEKINYENGHKFITKQHFSTLEELWYHPEKDVVIARFVFKQGIFETDAREKDYLYPDTAQKFDTNGVILSKTVCHLLELDSTYHEFSLYKCSETIYKNGDLSFADFNEHTKRVSKHGITTKFISKQQHKFKDYENGYCSKYSFYNSRGNLEVEIFAPFLYNSEDEIVEKRLYIDGEYIKTKCFVPYSKVRGFIEHKQYCLDGYEYKEKEFTDKEKTCFDE